MSKFTVGDKVRCISSTGGMKPGDVDTVTIADPSDGTMRLSEHGGWWFRQTAFEHATEPAESPDDWVTQDVVVRRVGVDECRWISIELNQELPWVPTCSKDLAGLKHGSVNHPWRLEVRCRRKDLPVKPTETLLSSGGPYVARSEYERVQYDLNAVKATLEKRDAELTNLRTELANEKASSGQVIAGLRDTISVLSDHIRQMDKMMHEPIPAARLDPLPVPKPPVWLRAGWWYGYNSDGTWWVCDNEPVWSGTQWSLRGWYKWLQKGDMRPAVDKSRASEACWQVK